MSMLLANCSQQGRRVVTICREIRRVTNACRPSSTRMHRGRTPRRSVNALLAGILLVAAPAFAADDSDAEDDGIPSPSIATSLPDNGDPLGLRKWLAQHGFTFGWTYTSEALANLSGGVQRGGLYEGKLEAFVAVDLEKLAGAPGLSFFVNGFQILNTSGLRDWHFESLITI